MKGNKSSIIPECNCARCGYSWTPRIRDPKSCPDCKSRDYKKKKVA